MLSIELIIWLFPILFMLHDFEEIILVKAWFNKNSEKLISILPAGFHKIVNHLKTISTASFSLGVAEEFLLISIVAFCSLITRDYKLWLGLFVAFSIHLVIHIIQSFIVKAYVPSLITSIICLPICYYIINIFLSMVKISIENIILFSCLGLLLMIFNLIFIHKIMFLFDKWLNNAKNNI